jgi:hypothetical protein
MKAIEKIANWSKWKIIYFSGALLGAGTVIGVLLKK